MNGLKVARIRGQKSRRGMNDGTTLTHAPNEARMNSAFCAVNGESDDVPWTFEDLAPIWVYRSSSRHALIPRCRAGYLQSPSKNRRLSWNVHAGHLSLETSNDCRYC